MRLRFRTEDLQRLYEDREYRVPQFGPDLTKQYRKKVGFLQNAADERDLYNYKALHYEKLKGDREGQRSIRLNDQWRLIVELETDEEGRLILIVDIDDYH